MKIIATANSKGGVGKTTSIDCLAVYLALIKKNNVLLLDFDPSNCGLSKKHLKMESDPTDLDGWQPPIHPSHESHNQNIVVWDGRSSTASIFLDTPVVPYPSIINNIEIIPAYSSKLNLIEGTSQSLVKEKIHDKLYTWFKNETLQKKYDFVLIDTPPVRFKTTSAVIHAATNLIIPTSLEPLPIEGLFGMLQLWSQENLKRNKDNPLDLLGILPNMYRKRVKIQDMYLDFLKNNAGASQYLMPFELNLSSTFSESDHNRIHNGKGTIFDLPKTNKSRQQVQKFCEYVYERIKKS